MNKIFIIFLGILLLTLSLVNAEKVYDVTSNKIKINDENGKEKINVQLIFNTYECSECMAIIKIETKENNIKDLLEKIEFKDLKSKELKSFSYELLIDGSKDSMNQVNKKLENKGIYYLTIKGKKNAEESLDWIPTILGEYINEWAVWGAVTIYDEINDSNVNYALWENITTGTYDISNISETSDLLRSYLFMSGKSGTQRIATKNLPYFGNVENLTIKINISVYLQSGGTLAYTYFNAFGNTILYLDQITDTIITDTSIWTFRRNTTNFDVYNDGVYNKTIVPSSNEMALYGLCNSINGCYTLNDIYYVYYTISNSSMTINQTSPIAFANTTTNLQYFYIDTNVTINNLRNITLYLDGKLNETKTITGLRNSSVFTKTVSDGLHNWTIRVCDNDTNCKYGELRYFNNTFLTINGVSYSTNVQAGSNQTFVVNITYNNNTYTTINGNLVYDGTSYPLSLSNQGVQSVSKSITIPSITNITQNKTFYWSFTLVGGNTTKNAVSNTYSHQISTYVNNFYFYQNGAKKSVLGYIQDQNSSISFNGTEYTSYANNYTSGLVFLRFLVGTWNSSSYNWDNKSQYYEYDNSENENLNVTIEMFGGILAGLTTKTSYFQLQDNLGNLIKEAKVQLYGVVPNQTGQQITKLYGQRITDNNGMTSFNYDSWSELYLKITKDGYKITTIRLTASELNALASTSNGYNIIRMEQSDYVTHNDVFIGGLYKYDGTYIKESKFDDITKNYYLFISDDEKRTIKYHTEYNPENYTVALDGSNVGVIELLSNIHFDATVNDSINISIYADDELTYNFIITFEETEEEINIDITDQYDNTIFRNIFFIALIMVSSLAGIMIKTGEGDVGLHIFMTGCLISPLIVGGLVWLSWIAGIYYGGKLVKQWISQ